MQVEDRPIVKEIKTYVREHHPVEKEFVVETRPTGQCMFIMGDQVLYNRLFAVCQEHDFALCVNVFCVLNVTAVTAKSTHACEPNV